MSDHYVGRLLSCSEMTYIEIFLGEIVVDVLYAETCAPGISAKMIVSWPYGLFFLCVGPLLSRTYPLGDSRLRRGAGPLWRYAGNHESGSKGVEVSE